MALVFTAQIRVTKEQRERLKERAKLHGFHSMSAYLRYLGLERDERVERDIREMRAEIRELHAHFFGAQPRPKFKTNRAALGGVMVAS
jgi:hypothetical protein